MVPRRGLAPPIGDDPTHKPLKTRLSLDFSSCNRRILVYGLVYDQDTPRERHPPLLGYRFIQYFVEDDLFVLYQKCSRQFRTIYRF